jgi:hypothetical protein
MISKQSEGCGGKTPAAEKIKAPWQFAAGFSKTARKF